MEQALAKRQAYPTGGPGGEILYYPAGGEDQIIFGNEDFIEFPTAEGRVLMDLRHTPGEPYLGPKIYRWTQTVTPEGLQAVTAELRGDWK